MRANEKQKEVITTLNQAIQVSAGAGTGKTKTLSERLLYAFESHGDTPPYLDEAKEIIAITFTKKAAAELAHRVRRGLKDRGLHDISRKIDEAWISTIDSMCSRIVRENSLTIGINPEYTSIAANELDEIIFSNLEELIKEERMHNIVLADLIEMYSLDTIYYEIQQLSEGLQLNVSGGDLSSITDKQTIPDPHSLLIEALLKLEVINGYAQANKQDMLEVVETQIKNLNALEQQLYEQHLNEYDCLKQLTKQLIQFMPRRAGKIKPFVDEYYSVLFNATASLLQIQANCLLNLAQTLNKRMWDYAHQHASYSFTQIELLALDCLSKHQNIREMYKKQFKIIMVDEFQDTNELQINIIKALAKDNLENLCTVGDAQQAIYEFRGADVEVYLNHKSEMKRLGAKIVQLDENYRSHACVLKTVDEIFSQQEVFGNDFLNLIAKRDESQNSISFSDEAERIHIIDRSNDKDGESVTECDLAINLANKLRLIKETQGIPANSMCVLLEALKGHDTTYIEALNNAGFEVLVHGGSAFFESKEVQLLIYLLKWASNEQDDISFINILLSDMFMVDENELIQAGNSADYIKYSLYERILNNQSKCGDFTLYKIINILNNYRDACNKTNITQAYYYVLEASSYDMKLLANGAQGKAQYANILKFIDIIRELNTEGIQDIDEILLKIDSLQNDKEAPATLDSKEAIHLMTIHASKGLEYPVVAVGSINNRFKPQSYIAKLIRDDEGNIQISAGDKFSKITKFLDEAHEVKSQVSAIDLDDRQSVASNIVRNTERIKEKSYFEKYRKYYVALTRARDALVLCTDKNPRGNARGVRNMILKGLLGDKEQELTFQSEQQQLKSQRGLNFTYTPLQVIECQPKDRDEHEFISADMPLQEHRGLAWIAEEEISIDEVPQIFSFSKITREDNFENYSNEDIQEPALQETQEQASSFGVIVHALLEHIALYRNTYLINPKSFIERHLAILAKDLDTQLIDRLYFIYNNFIQTNTFKDILNAKYVHPELEFAFKIFDNEGLAINFMGFIDLVFHDTQKHANIIDYKTGYKTLTHKQAQEKFLLQAQIYAYAMLEAGFNDIDIRFIRLELNDCIEYHFNSRDKDGLYTYIYQAYRAHLVDNQLMIKD